MELTKILKIFYTAWIVIFAIIFLTRCKSNPKQTNENIAIENKMLLPADAGQQTDSLLTVPNEAAPATTSVAVNETKETKPVKLIYLK